MKKLIKFKIKIYTDYTCEDHYITLGCLTIHETFYKRTIILDNYEYESFEYNLN